MIGIHLSARLKTVSDFIRKGSTFADIGTDHGQLICYLAQNNIINKGYACDVNNLPLKKALSTIIDNQLEDKVEVFLTDGLEGLEEKNVTDIAMAGMGGELISNIMGNACWIKNSTLNFVLQPMTRDYKLRVFLINEGFSIIEEKAVSCGKFIYTIMQVQYTGIKKEITPHYAWAGELWNKCDSQSIDYLKSRMVKLQQMKPSFNDRDGYSEMLETWEERLGKC